MAKFLTTNEAAAVLGVTPGRVKQLVYEGKLKATKRYGRIQIEQDAVMALKGEREEIGGRTENEREANLVPILRNTGLITVRDANGHQAFTVNDIAEALEIRSEHVRARYSENRESWGQDETFVFSVPTPAGMREVRVFTARGAMRFCRFIKSERSDILFNHLLDLWEAERSGEKRLVDSEALAAILGELKDLRERVSQPQITDPKVLIAKSIADNLAQFAPAVQKIVVTTALALPPEKQAIWTAAQIRTDLEGMGVDASWQKIGLTAKAYGIQCPKEEQENEYGFWATTSINNFSKVVPQFQYNKAGRDRLIAIFTSQHVGA